MAKPTPKKAPTVEVEDPTETAARLRQAISKRKM